MDIKKLEQAINNTDSICAKGKADVKLIFEAALDITFESTINVKIKLGQIYSCGNGELRMIVKLRTDELISVVLVGTNPGDWMEDKINRINDMITSGLYEFKAHNLKEYIENGGKL